MFAQIIPHTVVCLNDYFFNFPDVDFLKISKNKLKSIFLLYAVELRITGYFTNTPQQVGDFVIVWNQFLQIGYLVNKHLVFGLVK